VSRRFRGTTAAAAIQRHQAPLLAVEAVVCCNRPFVESAPAQGLALRQPGRCGLFEPDYVTHGSTSRLRPAASDLRDTCLVETGSLELRPETLQQGRCLDIRNWLDGFQRHNGLFLRG
jgi:hypothetical protein